MKTQVIKLDQARPDPEKVERIATVISGGGVIVYPTETFYGIGADGFSEEAVARVFRIKKRPSGRALPVIVADMEMAKSIVRSIPPLFEELTSLFWPGPLTLILKAASHLPERLLGPGRTIGLRLPALSWLRSLVRQVGSPVIATSANISGGRETSSPEKVIPLFRGHVDLIVDGGKTPGRLPSTVVDLSSGKARLVREGALPSRRLKKYLASP